MIHRIALFLALLQLWGCTSENLITDRSTVKKILHDFNQRSDIPLSMAQELRSILAGKNKDQISQCMNFLYAYMPLNDIADYTPSFFYENSEVALKARAEMPWGKQVPYDVFLHYVLPVRVNNENLDNFRPVCYEELKARVANLKLADAALEINRWCHEKVTYQASDIRTSAPLATMLSARGRCGEESTFTVAALRTVGIPARQVYTPRWAHSDDNHAWVEVWIDGEWFYMGACEPEPILDRGWFTEPARRAMLVHTKAFGFYSGTEKTIRNESRFAEINNLSKYAVTKNVVVSVLGESGLPADEGTIVEFCLYNYAEFYPIAKVKTDKNGYCSFETGLGDLMIWSGSGDRFGYEIISVASVDTVALRIDRQPAASGYMEVDLSVPAVQEPFPPLSPELRDMNRKLLARGDSIRQAYISSWISRDSAFRFAGMNGYDASLVAELIVRSHGNYQEIMSFLRKSSDKKEIAVNLLSRISDKDLRDARESVLSDHLNNTVSFQNSRLGDNHELYYNYILNPRVANENLSPWRSLLTSEFESFVNMNTLNHHDIQELIDSVEEMVSLNDTDNFYGTPLTPVGVLGIGAADDWSRRIFTVAVLRSVGIPSRLEPGTDRPQYHLNGEWTDIWFKDEEKPSEERSFVTFLYDGTVPEPEYYIHFTLARFQDGKYETLSYDYNKRVSAFPERNSVLPGYYLLITGNRIDDSNILASLKFFKLGAGEIITIDVTPRKETEKHVTFGKLTIPLRDGLISVLKPAADDELSLEGIISVWLNPETEPAKHLIGDLKRYRADFEDWTGRIALFVADDAHLKKLESIRNSFPVNAIMAVDRDFELMNRVIAESERASSNELPYVMLTDSNGEIYYVSSGYKIGIAGQLIKRIHNN